ncbi:MAG: aminoacyl-tRNA hydrolase [Opitutales bacterium]|nr:aminoacyl-tRNA hydrolase [Opitutales bacterium]
MSLKIAIGLGNSGEKYARTRHNAGVIALGELARACGAGFSRSKYCSAYLAKITLRSKPLVLAVADGYMNESGSGAAKILSFCGFDISEAAVLHDDINLEAGRIKLSRGGSPGGHNGVADIIDKCSNAFMRVRLGIGAKPDKRMDLADYVLGVLPDGDLQAIKSADVGGALGAILTSGFEAAQNVYNRKSQPPSGETI